MAFCSNCGNELNNDVVFCDNCGTSTMQKQFVQELSTNVKRGLYGFPMLVNGALAITFGFIGYFYHIRTTIGGAAVRVLKEYSRVLESAETEYLAFMARVNAADRLRWLIGVGACLIVVGIIMLIKKPIRNNKTLRTVLWLIPMGVILIYVIINYIPLFSYALKYN